MEIWYECTGFFFFFFEANLGVKMTPRFFRVTGRFGTLAKNYFFFFCRGIYINVSTLKKKKEKEKKKKGKLDLVSRDLV